MKRHYEITEDKYLSDDELAKVKGSLTENRDSLIITLLLETGARSGEILNITVGDLDLNKGTILIHGLKGSESRRLPLKQTTKAMLKSYIEEHQPEEAIFNITTRRLRQIWERHRPAQCTKGIHSLRHTFAILLYKKTKDLRMVQFALGHRSIKNTMVYANYVYKTEELSKIWDDIA